jgi:1-acyl-sn-glycerol-3-phosphate acyltransferase
MAKKDLFKNKFIKWYFETNGSFSVDKDGSDPAAVKKAIAVLKDGDALVIYPEGKRHRDDVLGELATGIGFLAAKSRAPVVPVGISGLDKIFRWKYKIIPTFSRAKVVIGEPITDHMSMEGKTSEISNAIIPIIGDHILELYRESLAL